MSVRPLEALGWGLLGSAALAAALIGESAGEALSVVFPACFLVAGAGALAADRLLHGGGSRSGFLAPAAVLGLVLTLAALRGSEPWAAWVTFLTWGMGLAAAVLLALWASPAWAARAALPVLSAGAALAAYGLYQRCWGLAFLERAFRADPLRGGAQAAASESMRQAALSRLGSGEPTGSFAISNTLAAFMLLLIPLSAGLALDRLRGGRRGAAAFLTILASAGLLVLALTGSKGAWVSGAAVLGLWGLARLGRTGWVLGLLAGALALGWGARQESLQASTAFRLGYWSGAGRMLLERPWDGLGLGGFEAEYNLYRPVWARDVRRAHCDPLQLWAEAGIWAPLALSWLWVLLWKRGRAGHGEAPGSPSPLSPLLIGMLAGVAFLLSAPLASFRGDLHVKLLAGFCVALVAAGAAWAGDGGWGEGARRGALAATAAVGLHALGDFSLWVPGLALAAWTLLGALAAQTSLSSAGTSPRWRPAAALALIMVAGLRVGAWAPAMLESESAADRAQDRLARDPGPLPGEDLEALRLAVEGGPARARTWMALGAAESRRTDLDPGAFARAEAAFRRAAATRAGDANIRWALARLFWDAAPGDPGRIPGALAWTEAALEAFPGCPRSHLIAGRIYRDVASRPSWVEASGRTRTWLEGRSAAAYRQALALDARALDAEQRLTEAERAEAASP